MTLNKKLSGIATLALLAGMVITGCQKMDRPPLKDLLLDPPPPPYSDLKTFFSFENNVTDAGENKLSNGVPNAITYETGINGQAAKIGTNGYILFPVIGDTITYTNGFKGIPADTLTNLGSYTLSFWLKSTGPFTDGAQGVFSISNKNEFWGNLDLFLENYNNAGDQTEGFLKVHMFNAGVSSGNGEEWNEVKITNFFNKWTHLAVVYNAANSQLSIYADGAPTAINGKVLGGGNYGKIKWNNFNGMVIGNHQFQTSPSLTNHGPEGWARPFNGPIDQLRLYNRALSASEINGLFTSKD